MSSDAIYDEAKAAVLAYLNENWRMAKETGCADVGDSAEAVADVLSSWAYEWAETVATEEGSAE